MNKKELMKRIEKVRQCRDIQCSKGNNNTEYHNGMANALILAVHTLDDEGGDCPFIDRGDHRDADRWVMDG